MRGKSSRGGAVCCPMTVGMGSHWMFRSHSVLLFGWENCPAGLLTCLKGSRERKLRRNSVDVANAVDVLD